jgi:hypothetical protein
MKLLGIIILIVGLVLTLYTGFTYITKEKIVDVGNLEITTEKEHAVNWKPYFGFGVMAIGAVVLVLGRKKAPAL